MSALKPGTIVRGPFYSDGHEGAGVIVAPGREIWTRVLDEKEYIAVKVLAGDRGNGGYRKTSLKPCAL